MEFVKKAWATFRRWPTWVQWVSGIFVLLLVVGAVGGGSEDSGNSGSSDDTTTEEAQTTTAEPPPEPIKEETTPAPPPPKPKPKTPRQKVRDALLREEVDASGYAGVIKIRRVEFGGGEVQVTAKTPKGGFEGASCGDVDDGAREVFQHIYGKGKWKQGAVVVFRGGLFDKSTGKSVNDETGIFTLTPAQAKRIDWADNNAVDFRIDWTIYRDFCHPALK